MRPSVPSQQEKIDPDGNKRTALADTFDELDFEYVTGVAEKAMSAVTAQRCQDRAISPSALASLVS
jgi:hypothetical protein